METMKADRDYMKLADLPRRPNPHPETRIVSYKGFDCKIWFNYVDQGEHGMSPANHWWATLEPNSYDVVWASPLREEVKTLDEACEVIMPTEGLSPFMVMIQRMKK